MYVYLSIIAQTLKQGAGDERTLVIGEQRMKCSTSDDLMTHMLVF